MRTAIPQPPHALKSTPSLPPPCWQITKSKKLRAAPSSKNKIPDSIGLSHDPLSFAAGDTNTYRYAGNSATNATDPSGLQGVGTGTLGADADSNVGMEYDPYMEEFMKAWENTFNFPPPWETPVYSPTKPTKVFVPREPAWPGGTIENHKPPIRVVLIPNGDPRTYNPGPIRKTPAAKPYETDRHDQVILEVLPYDDEYRGSNDYKKAAKAILLKPEVIKWLWKRLKGEPAVHPADIDPLTQEILRLAKPEEKPKIWELRKRYPFLAPFTPEADIKWLDGAPVLTGVGVEVEIPPLIDVLFPKKKP